MKSIGRSAKSPIRRSPGRKLTSVPKPGPSRPPLHRSGSSRPPIARGRSPTMKHRPSPHLRKTSHHPRPPMPPRRSRSPHSVGRDSPVPVDRIHPSKFVKKRKPFSRSPPPPSRRLSSPPLHGVRPRNGSIPSDFDAQKKKIRRDLARMSPGHRPSEKSLHGHPDSRIPHRTVGNPDAMYAQDRAREYPSPHASNRPSFSAAGHSREGSFNLSSSERSRPRNVAEAAYSRAREDYITDREPTLDERFRGFSSEAGRGPEHRIQFSRSDLENITIDVNRGAREPSPTIRRIVNPSEVKLVRRPLEGNRPIFDREEIKHSSRDLREDPYNEQKLSSGRNYGLNYKELENYEITRHKFDTYRGPPLPPAGAYTLGNKWQMFEGHKSSATTSLDRDERPPGYTRRSRSPPTYAEKSHMRRSHSTDRDFRGERYPSGSDHRPRPAEYVDTRRPLPNDPSDLRHSLAVKRKDGTLHDARQRILERRNSGHDRPPSAHGDYRHYPGPSRRPPESSSERIRERRSVSPVRRMEPSRSRDSFFYARDRSLERGRPREEKSDFPPRSDKYKYLSWAEKSDMITKGSSHYEHDNRESSFRSRGSSRGFRPRGLRGRSFRGGLLRGSSSRGRSSFRGSSAPRGRGGYPIRRGRHYSPHLWEHDMYDKALQDH